MAMRRIALGLMGCSAFAAAVGSAISLAAPASEVRSTAVARSPSGLAVAAALSDFPRCPAPAINGINIRASRSPDGALITAFVVVQNVGQRAFFAAEGDATVRIALGQRALGSFALQKLMPSEVRFFSVEARLGPADRVEDLVASLDFAATAPTGPVAGTLDCQMSDNRAV